MWNRTITLKDTWAKEAKKSVVASGCHPDVGDASKDLTRVNADSRVTSLSSPRTSGSGCTHQNVAKRAIDSREHLFFPENFEQMIQARPGVAAGDGETGRMNERADLHAKLCRSRFQRRFEFRWRRNFPSAAKASRTALQTRLVLRQ